MPPPPGLTTRREFLERSAAAAALLALPWAAGCASGSDRRIVRAAIHPTIGVARVGNSPDSFFFGPEVPGALPRASGGFKDGNGAVAKQAARFRVYGLDADGRPVRELTAAEADITWRVSVANTKAAWYDFSVAYDLPDAAPAALRNPRRREAGDGSSSSRANAACTAPGHARFRSTGRFSASTSTSGS